MVEHSKDIKHSRNGRVQQPSCQVDLFAADLQGPNLHRPQQLQCPPPARDLPHPGHLPG